MSNTSEQSKEPIVLCMNPKQHGNHNISEDNKTFLPCEECSKYYCNYQLIFDTMNGKKCECDCLHCGEY